MSDFLIKDDTFLLTSQKDSLQLNEKQNSRVRLKKRNDVFRHSNYKYSKFSSKVIGKETKKYHKVKNSLEERKTQRKKRYTFKVENLKKRSKFELMNEAFYIANLFYVMNQSKWTYFEDEYYIISTNWFEKWKKYVYFDYYIKNADRFLKLGDVMKNPVKKDDNNLPDPNNSLVDQLFKEESEKYFLEYFLKDNMENYPGYITNNELLIDRGLHYMDFVNKKSIFNYNIIDQYENGREFFLINKPIWNYFKAVYGGKEIKRYSITISNSSETIVELKLKNINLSIIKTRHGLSIEKPKLIFYSRKYTLYNFKRYLIKIFSFLNDKSTKHIRLWALDRNISFDQFEDFLHKSLKDHLGNQLYFPGHCLEKCEDYMIGNLEKILSEHIIVLEHQNERGNFIFRSQHNVDIKAENLVKDFFDKSYNINTYWQSVNNNSLSFSEESSQLKRFFEQKYDDSIKNSNSFFTLNKFFVYKYGINLYSKKKFKVREKEIVEKEFQKEIEIFRNNIDLFLDKSEILQKYRFRYSEISDDNKDKNINKTNKKEERRTNYNYENSFVSKYKAKLIENYKKKTMQQSKSKEEQNKQADSRIESSQSEIKLDENLNQNIPQDEDRNFTCNYCSKTIESEEYETCEKCNVRKYCNEYCKNKDSRFHLRKCV